MFLVIGGLSMMSHHYTLGNIKSRTVGDGQHGTARWATDKEIKQTYAHVPFKVREWRRGQNLPTEQGLILGCKGQQRYWQDRIFPVPQSGICLRLRHELAGAGQQG